MNTAPQTCVIAIDCQNDFCSPGKEVEALEKIGDFRLRYPGSLFVPGADEDMFRAADFIRKNIPRIHRIFATLDLHHTWSIFHPCFWVDEKGVNAAPFTPITSKEIRDGRWRPAIPSMYKEALAYAEGLEAKGRYTLMVWPSHCTIGSIGSTIFGPLMDAFTEWEMLHPANLHFEGKGMSPLTEMYSAIQAEIPRSDDPSTQMNTGFVNRIAVFDRTFVLGEALSHCVAYTMGDIFDSLPAAVLPKITLLEDCMSSVPGFEDAGKAFLDNARQRGVQVMKSTDVSF